MAEKSMENSGDVSSSSSSSSSLSSLSSSSDKGGIQNEVEWKSDRKSRNKRGEFWEGRDPKCSFEKERKCNNCEQDFVTMTDYYTGHEGQPVSMQQNEAGAEIRTSQRKYLNFCGKDICQMAAKCHRSTPHRLRWRGPSILFEIK